MVASLLEFFQDVFGNPVVLGVIMGSLVAIAPDHLAALLSVTAGVAELEQAALLGIRWGLGHALGMAAACTLAMSMQSLVNEEAWEHSGAFVAGALLGAAGAYFLYYEEFYLDPEGNHCHCCGWVDHCSVPQCSPCDEHGDSGTSGRAPLAPPPLRAPLKQSASALKLLADGLAQQDQASSRGDGPGRRFWSTMLGFFQGLVCPSCLVVIAPASQAAASGGGRFGHAAVFFLAFTLACTAFTALAAMTWSLLSVHGAGRYLSQQAVYRCCCGFTVFVGALWIVMDAIGRLDTLEPSIGPVAEDSVLSLIHCTFHDQLRLVLLT